MTSSIQRIQEAISQADMQTPSTPASQSLVCSFDIEGRSQEGYLGVKSIAEVTPPWFPKAAFQLPKNQARRQSASPIITLKRPQSQTNVLASQENQHQVAQTTTLQNQSQSQALEKQPVIQSDKHPSTEAVLQSSVSVDVFQAVANNSPEVSSEELTPAKLTDLSTKTEAEGLESPAVTAELLASLFEQAEPLATDASDDTAAASPPLQEKAELCLKTADPSEQLPNPAILAPVSEVERAAAEALAQSLSKTLEKSLEQPQDKIKPIETVEPPALPRSKTPELSSHQNSTNPMLPLGLLQDIGKEVIVWQQALQEVHQKIQSLYQEGPILNGWLEQPNEGSAYLLCGLDTTGQAWRRPCPPDQLHRVSLAISRYKKLRLLLGEKQRLDQRLQRLSETLTMLRLRLRAY